MSHIQDEDAELYERLEKLSCPFTWKPASVLPPGVFYTRKDISDRDDVNVDVMFPVASLISCVTLCYEQARNNIITVAEKELEYANQHMIEIKRFTPRELRETMNTLEHVLNATKCHILYKKGDTKEVQNILQNIVNKADMTIKELGALDGCQSLAWGVYMEYGRKQAVEFAMNAVKLNPENSFWHFTLARCLRLSRRQDSIFIPLGETEKYSFKKAYDMSQNPVYGMYLAQMYRESMNGQCCSKQQKIAIEKQLFLIYKGIIGHYKNLPLDILLRAALGLIRLKTIDAQVHAKKCLDEVEKMDPDDSMYLHYKAIYFERYEPNNVTEILKYLKAASELNNFAAEIVYLEYAHYENVDPIDHLQKMLIKYDVYHEDYIQTMMLALGTLHYLKKDINAAAKYYLITLEMNPNALKLKNYYKLGSFNTRYTRSVYGFLGTEFLPELSKEADASSKEFYSKIKAICDKYMSDCTNSCEIDVKNMSL